MKLYFLDYNSFKMNVTIKIPELVKPELVGKLYDFIQEESKKLKKEIIISVETHSLSRVKITFVNAFNHPYDWNEFMRNINAILELDKH